MMEIEVQTEIDVIILSFAHNHSLLQTTKNAVISLLQSENHKQIKFNVVVIESQKRMSPYQYPGTTTLYPEQPFGYHRYMNIGINATNSPYICICNNDLIFHPNWASEILKQMSLNEELASASPIASNYHPNLAMSLTQEAIAGYRIGYEITGWCLFYKRELIKTIGILDENYQFSGADYDYAYTLWVCGIKHALVTASVVDHIAAQTLKTQTQDRQDQLTKDVIYHKKKWGSRVSSIPEPELTN